MSSIFDIEVFHNPALAPGATWVDSVITITAPADAGSAGPAPTAVEMIMVDMSGSMDRDDRFTQAIEATCAAIEALEDGTWFAVIAGTKRAFPAYPEQGPAALANPQTKQEAIQLVRGRLRPSGGTAMGAWVELGATKVRQMRDVIKGPVLAHGILLTDGKNEHESRSDLDRRLAAAEGVFQVDCRGIGADWEVAELRHIASRMLGTADIVASGGLAGEFRSMMTAAMGKQMADVGLRVWTPKGAKIAHLRQVAPAIEELTDRGIDPGAPFTKDYPTGAWAGGESRDYHLRVEIPTGEVGQERRAARIQLVIDGAETEPSFLQAFWTDDETQSTRIVAEVAHYTGQAELAAAIDEGLAARKAGDVNTATVRLGQAVKLAAESGNDGTVRLLEKVVDVEDAASGTVRLKAGVQEEDEMALDVRSTRTVRVKRGES